MVCRAVTTTVLVTVLAMSGCSGGGDPETWRPGEIRTQLRLCDAISADLQRRLRVEPASDDPTECEWEGTKADVHRRLEIEGAAYRPATPRPAGSATDVARYMFRTTFPRHERGPGYREFTQAVKVHGLGDEAEVLRSYRPGYGGLRVFLKVRWRNVFFGIDLRDRSGTPLTASVLEAGVVAAALEVLTAIGAKPAPAPTAPAYLPGEVRIVGEVCDLVDAAAGRLAPGVRRYDHTPKDSETVGWCYWGERTGRRPSLTAEVEAITPSPVTGETGTQIATTLFDLWGGDRSRSPKLGDEHKIAHTSYKSGQSLTSTIFVRRGNLLVYVDYHRWHHPSKEKMDKEAIDIIKTVLAGVPAN